MRRFGIAATAAVIVVLLVAFEIIIIKSTSGYEPKVEAVFAKVKIPENTVITPDMLELRDVGASFLHRESMKSIQEAASKTARVELEQGEMVLSGKLESGDTGDIKLTNANNRLFSIEFKGDQANGWWLKDDQEVDIIFVPDRRSLTPVQQEQADTVQLGPADSKVAGNSPDSGVGTLTGGAQSPGSGQLVGARQDSGNTPAGTAILPKGAGIQVMRGVRIAAIIDENGTVLKETGRSSIPRYISFEVTSEQADFLAYAKGGGRLEISVIPQAGGK